MIVKDLMEELKNYDENARVIIVNWSNGQAYDPTVGSDDEDEGKEYCRIGF